MAYMAAYSDVVVSLTKRFERFDFLQQLLTVGCVALRRYKTYSNQNTP